MNAVVPIEQQVTAFAVERTELIHTLQNSVYPGAKKDSVELALSYCAAQRLDPLQKPVHIVPMWDKNIGSMRDVIMPGIGLYRVQAARTGKHAGTSEPEFGPMVNETIDGVAVDYPEWCKVVVYRMVDGCERAAFTAIEYWRENYATRGKVDGKKSDAPNAMWSKRPRGQIAKCAEAQALRKAFPELGAAPTAEEMEGKEVIEAEVAEVSANRPNTAAQVAKDAFDALTTAEKDFLHGHAMKIMELFEAKEAMLNYIESQRFDTEAQLAIWSLLPANVRSAIKAEKAADRATRKPTPAEYASQA